MEQWNNTKKLEEKDNNCTVFTMEQFLKEHYLEYVVQKKGLSKEELGGVIIEDKIKSAEVAESRNNDFSKITDYANFGKYQKKILFNILDPILGKGESRKLLQTKKSQRYAFTKDNCFFMNILLKLYEENNLNIRALLKGQFTALESSFIDFLYEGLNELAENKDTKLEKNELQEKWNLIFCPSYKEVYEMMEDLRADVLYYVGAISGKKGNDELFEQIKLVIRQYNEEIVNITKNKVEFPDIDFDELDARLAAKREQKKRRSENAKNAWKKRKNSEGGKK